MIMRPLKTKVSITLDTDAVEILKTLAEQDDRSFSQYINLIIKDYLKAKNLLSTTEKKDT